MATGHSHHRNMESTVSQTVVGRLDLSTTPVEIKAGTERLFGRTRFFLINDSSYLVYLNENPNFTMDDVNIIAFSGETIVFDVDPNPNPLSEPFKMYARLEEGTIDVRVLEVK